MKDENNVTISRADLEIIRNLNEAIQSQLRTIESLRKQNEELRKLNKVLLSANPKPSRKARIIPIR